MWFKNHPSQINTFFNLVYYLRPSHFSFLASLFKQLPSIRWFDILFECKKKLFLHFVSPAGIGELLNINAVCVFPAGPPLLHRPMEKMKRFKRRLSLSLRGSQTIDESLSELAEQMTIEENSSKDSGELPHHIAVIVCSARVVFAGSPLVLSRPD